MATTDGGDPVHLEIHQEEIHLGQIVEHPDDKDNENSIHGRGGKRESCGYLCASFGRSPDAISPSFYTVAILALAYMDSSCFDKSSEVHHGKKCTQYEFIEFTYARSSLEAIDWPKEYKMDNITDGSPGLLDWDCGNSANPCMKSLKGKEIKYAGFDTKLINLPNDWYPKFHHSMVEGVDYIRNISSKVPKELFPKENICDCRGGHARLGSKYAVAPSTVMAFSLPITCVLEILLFPYIGALTDYSPHRKNIWLTAFSLLMLTSMLIAVMWHGYIWVMALVCMILNGIFYDLQLFPIEAYLPEFRDPVKINGYSQAVYATGGVAFVVIGGTLSFVLPSALGPLYGTIATAMIAVLFVGFWGIAWTVPAAMRIQSRDATPLPEEWKDRNLFVVGFLRVFRTAADGFRKYPQVFKFWIYQALMLTWSDAVIFMSTSYFAQQLRMGQTEAILVVVCVLITIIPGTLFILWLNKLVKAKWLLLIVSIVAFLLTIFVALAIWQPRMKLWTFPLMIAFGLTFGAYYTLRSGVYATIIPGGEEALYTAVGLWFGNLLRWIPGLIYGVIVDASPTQSHRWAFMHLGIYPIIAACIIVFVDFDKADTDIADTLTKRKSDNKSRHSPSHTSNIVSPKGVLPIVVGVDPKVADSKASEASMGHPAQSIENDVGQHKHAQQHKQ